MRRIHTLLNTFLRRCISPLSSKDSPSFQGIPPVGREWWGVAGWAFMVARCPLSDVVPIDTDGTHQLKVPSDSASTYFEYLYNFRIMIRIKIIYAKLSRTRSLLFVHNVSK